MVYLDLSKEFIDNHKGGQEAENMICIRDLNTLTQLNEVNRVKILINGREDQDLKIIKSILKMLLLELKRKRGYYKKAHHKNATSKYSKTNNATSNTQTNKNDQRNK